jgi:glycosyltransferase involved in cell wall biosynthesis
MRGSSEGRFLIDGSMARGGGGYTYLVNIVPLLSKMAPRARFRVLVRTERLADALSGLPNVEVDRLPDVGLLARFRYLNFTVPRLAAEWRADLYFSVGEYSPARMPCPVVAAFRNPNVFTRMEQGWPAYQRLRLKALRALAWLSTRNADRILFVSEDSASWIGDVMALPEWKRTVVHHGIDTSDWNVAIDDPKESEKDGVILSVSSIYRYKNFVRLIEAYAQLAKQRPDVPDLVIVGDDQDPEHHEKMVAARAAAGEFADCIHLVGAVPYEQVREYYRNASLFVFPSYLETFGHPLLEAMGCDVPVVAADIPVFREIAGDAVLYADPFKVESLCSAMEDALSSDLQRRRMIERGRERVAMFSWDRSATRLLGMFDELIGEHAARPESVEPHRIRQVAAAAALALTHGSSASDCR